MNKTAFSTPMMQQYAAIKDNYPDALLFFRLGDFYELFMDDAELGAQILDITLTARPRGKDGKIPMAGVPYHAVDNYISKLVKAGHKVAICEQVSDPKPGDIVQREVVRVVTPATVMDEKSLSRKSHNYLISVLSDESFLAIAACDISTGHFHVKQFEHEDMALDIIEEITKINPAECILPASHYNNPEILKAIKTIPEINIYEYKNWDEHAGSADAKLKEHFGVATLKSFSISELELAKSASAAILGYLKEHQKSDLSHIKKIALADSESIVQLDRSSITNLELFSTIRDNDTQGSLLSVIDQTKTAMGGRLLKQWLIAPLRDKEDINRRLEYVDELYSDMKLREDILATLKHINDLERITARFASSLANPRDAISLSLSLQKVLDVKSIIDTCAAEIATTLSLDISNTLSELVDLISNSIKAEPSVHLKDGGIIKKGYDKKLDSLNAAIHKDRQWISELENKEKQKTGISTLKVGYNKVFGYYIEISNSNISLAPNEYIRKQTLVGGERFITPELKKREEKILKIEEQIKQYEYTLYINIVEKIVRCTDDIQRASHSIATIDVLSNFAEIAYRNNYVKPTLLYSNELLLKKSRHPVLEKLMPVGEFVANNVDIKPSKHSLLLITGPNMAGKSVLMRQVALVVLMAQVGSFVPAEKARIGIVDRIFVRSGASDIISSGLSTFMVEMVETAYILNHATRKSLIIMDEIGRGTSTYDGISIAWAVAENLIQFSPKTLFATHYHELQQLEKLHPKKIANYKMAIENTNGVPEFLYTFERGASPHSFGIAVARMAGVPNSVINNAQKKLKKLESTSKQSGASVSNRDKLINDIDINKITPLEALELLSKIQHVKD